MRLHVAAVLAFLCVAATLAVRPADFQIAAAGSVMYTTIAVGSLQQPFNFALDTRSTYSAVLSAQCATCPAGTSEYDPTLSNTSQVEPCSKGCYFCAPDSNGTLTCGLTMALAFDHEIRGFFVADTWQLTSGLSLTTPFISADFWSPSPPVVSTNNRQLALDGVLGLGPQSRLLPLIATALAASASDLTLCLGAYGGLGFVGLDPLSVENVLYDSAFIQAKMEANTPHLWALTLEAMSVDKTGEASRSPLSLTKLSPVTLAVASTAAIELPLEAWNWFRDTVWSLYCGSGQTLFGLCPQDQYDTSLFDISDGPVCFSLSSRQLAEYPNITITLAGVQQLTPVRLVLAPRDYLLLTSGGYCLNVLPFSSTQQTGMLLGAQLLSQYFLHMDAAAGAVGFARSMPVCALAKYVLNMYGGDRQTGVTGGILGSNLKVQVLDATTDAPVSGVTVRWQLVGGGGHELEHTEAITDLNGIAQTGLKLGPHPSEFLVSAAVDSALNSPQFFSGSSQSSYILRVFNVLAVIFLCCLVAGMAVTHYQVEKVRAAKQAAKEAAAAASSEKADTAATASWFPRRDPNATASVLNINASMRSFPAVSSAFGRTH